MLTLSPSGLLDTSKLNTEEYRGYDPTYVSRYLLLAGILETYRNHHGGQKLKVLEVGGSGSILMNFVDIELVVVDILPNADTQAEYIQGSALAMPFADKSFDAVISCDVLEHIPAEDRELFLKESIRVTKDLLVIAAPFNLDGVREAEIIANDFYKKMTGRDHRWLLEHLLDELPNLRKTETILEKNGLEVDYFSSTSLDNWQLVTRTGFLLSEYGDRPEFSNYLQKINGYYLDNVLKKDFSTNGYRTFVVASKEHDIDIKLEPDVYNKKHVDTLTLLTDAIVTLL